MSDADGKTLLIRRMLAALHNRGDWVTCSELAAALHFSKLSSYHLKLLQNMAEKGLIEMRPPYSRRWQHVSREYRAKP